MFILLGLFLSPSPLPVLPFPTLPNFLSWDRDPYLFIDPVSGQVTSVKQMDEISHNFIIANYNSLGAIDNVRPFFPASFLPAAAALRLTSSPRSSPSLLLPLTSLG